MISLQQQQQQQQQQQKYVCNFQAQHTRAGDDTTFNTEADACG
jgi:hypothetical protein